jgi:iodotyrosine deiodinase
MPDIQGYPFITYHRETYDEATMAERASDFYAWMDTRRTVRDFSDRKVPRVVIENIIRTASTAPSGAHKQPWTFCAINKPDLKKRIRAAAEKEEYESYHGRMSREWLEDLAPLGTDWRKPFLETAPWLIAVFRKTVEVRSDGERRPNYYVQESVGLACGFLLAAIHHAGLVALTHTPSPMNFLSEVLNRPPEERPFLLIPVGYPADEVLVPDLKRRPLEEVSAWFE